jgi:signal transduction histidine kinase
MRLKWKLRLYYGALLVVLLGLLVAGTAVLVLHQLRGERMRREADAARFARRLLEERTAAVDSAVARAARDPDVQGLVKLDMATSRDETIAAWAPLAARLAATHGLGVVKILDGEGTVLSSARWPGEYERSDPEGLVMALEAGKGVRLLREHDPHGTFLALEAPRWLQESRRYALIGGVRADSAFERDVAERAGTPLRFEWHDPPRAAPGTTPAATVLGETVPPPRAHIAPSPDWLPLPTSPVEATGGVRLSFDRSSVARLQRRLGEMFLAATLLGGLVAWMLGWWVSSRVTRPLEQLAEGVAVLAEGGTPRPIQVRGSAEVRDLVTSFNRMAESLAESRERLRRAERIAAWREVARRVAHEIKNSLAPIQISVENVARSFHTGRGDLRALVDEGAATVRDEVEALTRLVNAFNEMARLPEPEPQPHRLAETWERAASAFRDQMTCESVGLETLPLLLYDEDQVRRALHNLILNAQEAGAGRVRAEASAAPRGFQIVLTDDGPGVPPGDVARLFEPYFTRKAEGTGLGLAIVYKICTDHGWTVAARSPAGHGMPTDRPGTAFMLGIPAKSAAPV